MSKLEIIAAWWELQAQILYRRICRQMKALREQYPDQKTAVIIQPFTNRKVAMWLLVEGKECIAIASRRQIMRQARNGEGLHQCFFLKKTYTTWCGMMPVLEIVEELAEREENKARITMYTDLQTVRDFMVDIRRFSNYNFVWEFG